MRVFKFIDLRIFLISLVIGIFAVYMTMPDTRKIYVYPTPDNVDILQYRDKTNACFSVKQKEVACSNKISDIINLKPQQ